MFSNLPRSLSVEKHIPRVYGKEVLLDNWQERRMGGEEKTDTIVPGLQRVNKCEHHWSEVKGNYIVPFLKEDPEEAVEGTRHYLDVRNDALHNFQRNREVQVRFPFASDMMKNYTSTNKIVYDIVPKQQRQGQQRVQDAEQNVSSVPSRHKDLDLLLSYGNRSITGKRCQKQAELRLERIQKLQTTYAASYGYGKL